MRVEDFVRLLEADFFTGVPDSQLKALCDFLMDRYGIDPYHHIIAANEGNCTALAAGYFLATGRVPVVYLQNSGIGNIINPVASLLNDQVYAIPCIFVVGWRGEPGVHDEPQHIYQGAVTLRLLEDMDIAAAVLGPDTEPADVQAAMERFRPLLAAGKQAAFVVRKGALTFDGKVAYKNRHTLLREDVIRRIAAAAGTDLIVSTTGKASRELFELREASGQGHERDFLTVGSMGHSSSLALGIALQKPERTVWVIDGDGAALMHMGALALIGANAPQNLIHVLINNGAHETVGGMPTVAEQVDWVQLAAACGYCHAVRVDTAPALDRALADARQRRRLCLIEVKCAIGARADLGRPTTTARENRAAFEQYLYGMPQEHIEASN